MDDDDDRIVERSARKPPPKDAALQNVHAVARPVKRRGSVGARTVDPRFDATISKTNPNASEHQYAFMKELAVGDAARLRWRLTQARRELRRRHREQRHRESGELVSSSDSDSGADAEGLDEEIGNTVADRRDEIIRFSLLGDADLRREAAQMKQQAIQLKSVAGDSAARAKRAQARRQHMKTETRAVISGEKAKPFFLKRRDLKTKEAEARFGDLVESSTSTAKNEKAVLGRAHAAVSRYTERQMKRDVRGTRNSR